MNRLEKATLLAKLGTLMVGGWAITALVGLWIAGFYLPNPDSTLFVLTAAGFGSVCLLEYYVAAAVMGLRDASSGKDLHYESSRDLARALGVFFLVFLAIGGLSSFGRNIYSIAMLFTGALTDSFLAVSAFTVFRAKILERECS